MRNPTNLLMLLSVVVLCGCASNKPILSPALVQAGVSAAVGYGAAKYPQAVPYVRAAEPVICAASESTNLAPAEVVLAIQQAGVLKTPESVLIVNSALLLYSGIYNAFGADAVNQNELLQAYLKATCYGIGQGLPVNPAEAPSNANWPQVK